MPGGERYGPYPFSYRFLCFRLGGVLAIVYVVAFVIASANSAVSAMWWFGLAAGPVSILVLMQVALTVGWKAARARLRGVLSYDGSDIETAEIRSWRDLWQWMAHRRRDKD